MCVVSENSCTMPLVGYKTLYSKLFYLQRLHKLILCVVMSYGHVMNLKINTNAIHKIAKKIITGIQFES